MCQHFKSYFVINLFFLSFQVLSFRQRTFEILLYEYEYQIRIKKEKLISVSNYDLNLKFLQSYKFIC